MVFFVSFLMTSNQLFAGWDPEVVQKADKTIQNFLEKDSTLQVFFNKAYGYAVFPSVGKGAVGIGGAHGKGIVYKGGEPTGSTSMTQVTIGFQFGGKSYQEIIFFQNKKTYELFTIGKFELAAQASAVAITYGASADLDYNDGVAIITIDKAGLMYEASVGGQKFSYGPFEE